LSTVDIRETFEARPVHRVPDPVSLAVGSAAFISRHRFDDLRAAATRPGLTSRYVFSRYYFDAVPPVAIDFISQIRGGKTEVHAKTTYCEGRGIRYLVVTNQWDDESVEAQLRGVTLNDPEGPPPPLLTAPRRKRTTT
jgi:hypothetical protein